MSVPAVHGGVITPPIATTRHDIFGFDAKCALLHYTIFQPAQCLEYCSPLAVA